MTKNFVLAFGGTGARCVEALAYLYASRCLREPAQILVIDPDTSNGNVAVALAQLHRYHAIHHRLQPKDRNVDGTAFFSTPLNGGLPDSSFQWEYPNQKDAFSALIGYGALEQSSQDLLNLLFDSDDLRMTFEQGYVGRAHIGSLDLFRTLHDALAQAATDPQEPASGPNPSTSDPLATFFREIRSSVQGEQRANLVVLGSIFGGTGASGIPAIPPVIQEELPFLRDRLNIACVQVAPYFVFGGSRSENDPDSTLHPLATQTALYHYSATDTGYDRIYLVGAPERILTNEHNRRGGVDQLNKSHYVELSAALAAAHFFSAAPGQAGQMEVYACGSKAVDWSALPFAKDIGLRQNLVAFATFCLYHASFLYPDLESQRHLEAKWYSDLTRDTSERLGGKGTEMERLRNFADRFLQWAEELQDSADPEQLLGVDKRDRQRAETAAASLARISTEGENQRNPYHAIYTEMNRGRPVNQSSGTGWYLEALSQAVDRFCAANYRNWWGN